MTKLKGNILIIDDDPDILHTTRVVLRKHFANIRTERNPEVLSHILNTRDYDVILLDMNFSTGSTSGREGLEWLGKIKKADPGNIVIMITAYGDIDLAVKAMKEGAIDFVVKPWDNKKLSATVMAAYKLAQSTREISKYKNREIMLSKDMEQPFSTIIGKSQAMKEIFSMINKVGQTDANILILGENGTGKELIAREIHRRSGRSEQIFISVDLGAIAETLFESELFGHSKGSFTDAKQDRAGRFETASGGTLFLDEIGNLSLPLQAKLLSALENRKIFRIGSNKGIPIDIRLISATNMPLYEMVNEKQFRDDLLYRINTVEIMLPPLRERKKDIPLLVNHFLSIYSRKYKKQQISINHEAIRKMESYHWPGNIRELQHIIERALIMSENDEINAEDILLTAESSDAVSGGNLNIEELEKNAIKKALLKHAGNLTKAAKELGLGRTTLYRKMEKYGI